ncbi:carboxylesterase/lipase family protein [Novosphingobium sediminicola]|uniref:Carboxylic ester hydrolase n=1 Tax=Novosphingobium sediminicola TaxID=563162 RepID=A0A7W6G574_9SPHN|nr:carboxylesterase family protein [Novosphingobium sediminicola]MBB3953968.1 para-nitrobenzyl esterase [Novosphingobium sediminicola]
MTLNSGASARTDEPIAQTTSGKVLGARLGDVLAFRGIPYAQAPRFERPRPVAPWTGLREALGFGPASPQVNPRAGGPSPLIITRLPRPANALPPAPLREDEACQMLNIWTSGLRDGRKRPVMVWLHGGFFAVGSGATVDGAALARRGDVVVVSLNHRLNVLGFAHLDDLPGGEFSGTGNLGMLDIVAALDWLCENIEDFGGDPSRIMVFGQSGGGMKTSWLLASPAAKGRLHRAAVQSGPGLRMMERERAALVTDQLLHALDLRAQEAGELRRMPLERLMAGYFAVAANNPARGFTDLACFAPVLDPALLPAHPFSPAAPKQSRDVPLLIGWNAQEMSFFMGNDEAGFELDEAGLAARAAASNTEDLVPLYRQRYPDASPARRYIQSFSDQQVMAPTLLMADRKAAQHGAPVFAYRFDWQSPALEGKLGALHTLEAGFVFDTTDAPNPLIGGSAQARLLAHRMSSAWVEFAATGRPAADGLPEWQAYDDHRRIMALNNQSAMLDDPEADFREKLVRRYI